MYLFFLFDITWSVRSDSQVRFVSTQVEPIMNDFGVECIIE